MRITDSSPMPRGAAPRRVPPAAYALILAIYAVAMWSVFHRLPAFAPDTRYYSAMALRLTGLSPQESFEQVKAFVDQFGYATPGPDVLFGWGLVAPRIVYPLLSAPFVAVFGIPGMQVVPVIAMGVGLLLTLRASARTTAGTAVSLAVLLLLLSSGRMVFYGSAMLTESLSFALVAGMALCLPWDGQARTRRALVVGVGLMAVLAFTRQATLIPAAAVAMAYLGSVVTERSWSTPWRVFALWFVSTAVSLQVLQALAFPGFSQVEQFKLATKTESLGGALQEAPSLTWRIITTDISAMARVDLALLVLLLLALLAGVVRWRHVDSHLLVGALLATFLYNITNGTPTTFRYGFPSLVFVVVAVALFLRSVAVQRVIPASAIHPHPPEPEVNPSIGGDADRLGDHEVHSHRRQ